MIPKQIWEFIRTTYSYLLRPPKRIHKNKNNPPGRPIISGNGSLTENVSRYIDEYLRPSYITDTPHLLQIIDGLHIPEHALLV